MLSKTHNFKSHDTEVLACPCFPTVRQPLVLSVEQAACPGKQAAPSVAYPDG